MTTTIVHVHDTQSFRILPSRGKFEFMLQVVIIGVGHWHAARHLAALIQAEAHIVGVSDRDPAVAERWAQQIGCPAFSDDAALLDAAHPDFVFALPRHADAPAVAQRIIERDLPFAIEKPLGCRATDIEPLLPALRAKGLFNAVPFINRYSVFWDEVARLRQEGTFDPLVHAHFRVVNGPPDRYLRDGVAWMLDPAISGGGALRNLGIHTVDAFLRLAGEPVEVVAASISHRIYQLPIEEFGTALLRSESGATATIEAGYIHPNRTASDQQWRAAGRGAYLSEAAGTLVIGTEAGVEQRVVPTVADHYARFAGDTLAKLRRGEPPIANVEDCWRAMHVLDQIYAVAGVA